MEPNRLNLARLSLAALTLSSLAACTGTQDEIKELETSCAADVEITYPTSSKAPARYTEVAPDADTAGAHPITDHISYAFSDITVSDGDTGATYLADIDGWIRYPTNEPPASGWPVVLYLHGRHSTCEYGGGFETLGAGECPETSDSGLPLTATSPVESFAGYDYMAETLASHGYVVISGNANDVNDKDIAGDAGADARAQIILHTLDMFRDINAGNRTTDDGDVGDTNFEINDFSALVGAMDFEQVGIMGHSRGGQAVGHAVNYNRGSDRGDEGEVNAPHNLAAVFSLAPTDFDQITVTDTTFVTLLPYCDGDVSNLQGARTFDNTRYAEDQHNGNIFQLVTMGTNHNYYNTIWTSDDYSDGYEYCSRDVEDSGRDNPESQRRHGEFLMSSFFRLFLGNETQFLPYWQGKAQLPASACPLNDEDEVQFPCDERVHFSVIADPEHRIVVDDFLSDVSLTTNAFDQANSQTGFTDVSHCKPNTSGVGCPSDPSYSRAGQIALSWDGEATLKSEVAQLDVTGMDTFSFRIGVNEDETRNGDGQDLSVVLRDCADNVAIIKASDYSNALFFPPGDASYTEGKKITQNSVLIPLTAFKGVDLSRLVSTELVFDKTAQGDVQVTDLMFQNIEAAY
jgi:hypothetical protein